MKEDRKDSVIYLIYLWQNNNNNNSNSMNYLLPKTVKLLDDFLPLISESTHRITNYLSFYASATNQHF